MYKLFLALRYLRKRLIALFAVASVTLCVFMVTVVISVMGGFLEMVKERSRGLLSDIVVDNSTLQGFPYYQEFIDQLRTDLPDLVSTATPVIYNYAILRVRGTATSYTKPVRVVGIRLEDYCKVNDFAGSMYYNRYYPGTTTLGPQRQAMVGFDEQGNRRLPLELEEAAGRWRESERDKVKVAEYDREPYSVFPGTRVFTQTIDLPGYYGDELNGVIVGCDVINERTEEGGYNRYYARGCEMLLTVLPLSDEGAISGQGAITLNLRYADDSRTRVYEIDNMCVYVDFDVIQRVLGMEPQELIEGGFAPARASQVLVNLVPGADAAGAKGAVQDSWLRFRDSLGVPFGSPEYDLMSIVQVETWEERQVQFISAVEKEKVLVVTLFCIVSVVAVVLIGCIFYMVVEKKTRDIGIIKSLGASSGGVAAIFITYGAAVGVVGSAIGMTGAVYFIRYINEIQDALARFNPSLRVWSPDVYTFDRIPNTVDPQTIVVIVGIAILASMLGALVPAIRAARVWPVDALRYE